MAIERKEHPMDIVQTVCKCGAVVRAERGLLNEAMQTHIMYHILEEKRSIFGSVELVQAFEDAPRTFTFEE